MSVTTAITKRYYPALSEVIKVDDLPEFLHFAENGLGSILDHIHYKNFQYSKSPRGDSAFYSLDIISKSLGIDLPFGLRLILNPDEDGDSSISSFPVSLQYQWEVLAFLRSFNLDSFSFTPQAFFELGLKIFKISEEQVIAHVLNRFVEDEESTRLKFQNVIDAINEAYPNANIALPPEGEVTVEQVASLIAANPNIPESISEVMFAIYILDTDTTLIKDNLARFYESIVPEGIENYIKKLLIPKIKATLTLSAGIEFPNNVLRPVTVDGTAIPNAKTLFKFAKATFYADTEAGIGSQLELAGSLVPEYSQIGNTGLMIGFTDAKLDLSRKTNIPEADAAGYPADFMGLYVKHAVIGFNKFGADNKEKLSAKIIADELLIGTGGVSGKIALESNGLLHRQFGNFDVELNRFAIDFQQNSIIKCDIKGKLTIGRFKQGAAPAVIDIQAQILDNGDFNITALSTGSPLKITLPNVFELEVRSLSLGKQDRGFFVEVAGKLDFIADLPGLGKVLPKGIDIQKLRIWSNGDIEFEGGGLAVPKSFRLSVGPVKLEVNNISLGAYTRKHNGIERKYRFFGFDGMINTGRAGVNATGNGIKYYFTVDDNDQDKPFDSFASIDKIGIDLTVPGNASKDNAAFLLNGYLSMNNPDPAISGSNAGSEYTGSVSFSMPKLKMAGSAGMRMNPSIPAFVVDIGMELSTPIPLGATGLGIYGFRGLIGQHYLPSKSATTPPIPETGSWWDYYKAKSTITKREGIELDKFADKDGFSVGAGVSIATAFDSGKVFSSKLFLLLGLPDVFLIQGQAGILRSRIGLKDDVDPPFSAFIAIDGNSFRGNLGVNYRLPEGGSFDGDLFSLSGNLDMAFFFNNSSGWYLNVGKDQPENARVRAKILSLFNGYAYLMISSRGFKAGAGARFDFNKKFGPVAVGIGAYLDMGGSISLKPVQIGAYIQFGGYAYLKIFFIKLGLAVQIGLAVEAPHPFNISGSLELKVKLPWPIKNIKFRFEVSWYINNNDGPLLQPVEVLQLPDPAKGYLPAVATNILSNETFPLNYINQEISTELSSIPKPGDGRWKYNFNDQDSEINFTIPMDSFIDIELLKPVKPGLSKLGGASNQLPEGYSELMPPQKGLGNQILHEYELTGLDIYAWNPSGIGSWQPYHIYEAVTAITSENTGANAIDLTTLKDGFWQFTEPNKYNKIRLMSQNMFSYANQVTNTGTDLDGLNFKRKDLFCFETITKEMVINWKEEPLDTVYEENDDFSFKGETFVLDGVKARVNYNSIYAGNSLALEASTGYMTIRLSKPVTYLKLDFGPNENNCRIDYFSRVNKPGFFGKLFGKDVKRKEDQLSYGDQNSSFIYNDLANPINKVVLKFFKNEMLDFEGDLILGGYYDAGQDYDQQDLDKSILFARLFNKSLNAEEVLNKTYHQMPSDVGYWKMNNNNDQLGRNPGMIMGSPDMVSGFYQKDENQVEMMNSIYSFTSRTDAFYVPYGPDLKVENESFAFELLAVFNPFNAGASTLMHKVNEDFTTGEKKGFAIHLIQETPGIAGTGYDQFTIPQFKVVLTVYDGYSQSIVEGVDKYTLDCATGLLTEKQYKNILISFDRETRQLDLYIDQVLKASLVSDNVFKPYESALGSTMLNQITYLSESLQRRQEENEVTKEGFINEIKVLGDGMSKTVQPVWRPDTTFAIAVKTRDKVTKGNSSSGPVKTHVFGFKTAGPIGHFQQKSKAYKELEAKDRAAEFKLANLKHYIDYDRSFPDALSRYDLSKPVFCHDPKISLLFTKPYIHAMYANWDGYKGLPAVKSKLELQLVDPFGETINPELIWEQLPDKEITLDNFRSLPPDQQILFLMNLSALSDSCNANPISIKKRTKQGAYQLPDLEPKRLYTALFNAVYQPEGQTEQKEEVHKFSFRTSAFDSFAAQVSSFILDSSEEKPVYAIYPESVSFSTEEINNSLKNLIDGDSENDPAAVLNYAVKFDRLIYGGLRLKNPDVISHTVIQPVINVNPENPADRKILGILIRNPEPFNDPKLPLAELSDTVKMVLYSAGQVVSAADQFIYIHSRDTSAVFITNAAMELPAADMELKFKYKIFNGNDYQTVQEDYTSPVIAITATV
ncbi:hypothetical protein [Pedobacter gandavensis]|uniref:hypothetical protein n=1 Tax=Pedobacter gandavensis TaxID=2679963 RepID=UPI00292D4B8A|nr:hypothetical protein [Pedobacter gandavensis]